jgi:methionyl aminopeptidase
MENNHLLCAIKASKIHKEITKDLKENNIIQPGKSLLEITSYIENQVKIKTNYNPLKPLERGMAFPCSLSVNEIVAHYTPAYKIQDYIIQENDIIKVDFGVHEQGTIIDSALTFHFNKKYDEFIKISKDITNYAVSLCGPDAILGDIGKNIEEYIQSKEVEIDGKIHTLKTIGDLSGHNIGKYVIHNSKAVPNISIRYPVRMDPGEFFAVEPFITTGTGKICYDEPTYLFMLNKEKTRVIKDANNQLLELHELSKLSTDELYLYTSLKNQYMTLCFCTRWIEDDFKENYEIMRKYKKNLDGLVQKKFVLSFPAIYDQKEEISSQFEHTIYIKENGIVNLTKNEYY